MSRKLLPLITLTLFTLTVVGCASNKDKMAKNNSVLDVNAAPAAPRDEVAYTAPATATHQPAYYDAAVSQTPTAGAVAAAPAGGGSYVVKKGDTLFSIAKTSYGNGNQWQRIAAANPGLSPTTLKAGQKITLP